MEMHTFLSIYSQKLLNEHSETIVSTKVFAPLFLKLTEFETESQGLCIIMIFFDIIKLYISQYI